MHRAKTRAVLVLFMTRNFNAKLLFEIFLAFVKIGAVTFGGGLAMLPILERELSQKRGWVTQDELLDYYAIGQATPGIIAVNVATFCGHKLQGTLGGIVATLAIVTPSIIVITILAMFINSLDQIPLMQKALTGINIAVAANLSYSFLKLFKKTAANFFGAILMATAFVLIFFFKVNTVLIIFCAILLGIAIYVLNDSMKKSMKKNSADK